jgi:hypothetical protein
VTSSHLVLLQGEILDRDAASAQETGTDLGR